MVVGIGQPRQLCASLWWTFRDPRVKGACPDPAPAIGLRPCPVRTGCLVCHGVLTGCHFAVCYAKIGFVGNWVASLGKHSRSVLNTLLRTDLERQNPNIHSHTQTHCKWSEERLAWSAQNNHLRKPDEVFRQWALFTPFSPSANRPRPMILVMRIMCVCVCPWNN